MDLSFTVSAGFGFDPSGNVRVQQTSTCWFVYFFEWFGKKIVGGYRFFPFHVYFSVFFGSTLFVLHSKVVAKPKVEKWGWSTHILTRWSGPTKLTATWQEFSNWINKCGRYYKFLNWVAKTHYILPVYNTATVLSLDKLVTDQLCPGNATANAPLLFSFSNNIGESRLMIAFPISNTGRGPNRCLKLFHLSATRMNLAADEW